MTLETIKDKLQANQPLTPDQTQWLLDHIDDVHDALAEFGVTYQSEDHWYSVATDWWEDTAQKAAIRSTHLLDLEKVNETYRMKLDNDSLRRTMKRLSGLPCACEEESTYLCPGCQARLHTG